MMPKQVVLIGSPYLPAPYLPAPYLPAPYRPSSLGRVPQNRPSLGDDSIFDKLKSSGESIALGAAGVGAMYASGILPDPLKTVAMVGGIGLIGYAAYSLFGGTSKSQSKVEEGTTFAIPTEEEFAAISGQFLQPPSQSDTTQNLTLSGTYSVKVILSNQSGKSVSVVLQLAARETPTIGGLIEVSKGPEYLAIPSQTVALKPGNLVVEFSPSVLASRWFSLVTKEDLVLRKVRVAGAKAVDLDHTSVTLL